MFNYQDYLVESSLDKAEATLLIKDYLRGDLEIIEELKNNDHNYVVRINRYQRPDIVIKEPRKRNRRYWERLLTWFRKGEAGRLYESHIQLEKLGFACPSAVLAAESRKLGVVTRSVFMYEYMDGEPASSADAGIVARELRRLHEAGYTRGDPKAQNFLIKDGAVIFIDFKLSRARLWHRHSARMEFAHLLHTMPEALAFVPSDERKSAGFLVAVRLRRMLSDLKHMKRELRNYRQHPDYRYKRRAILLLLGTIISYDLMIATLSR
ncbi:lipopolysaccharide core heptose(II) kinase RfaY [Marinobacter vulgaris]|nr:lipopolysaccharide core heptose(II) kinase RfaY [Marinobacter vulgaris]